MNDNVSFPSHVTSVGKKIDGLDSKIISLMTLGITNKEISAKLKTPLSTIQRRTRHLIEDKTVSVKTEVNHEKMGIKRGVIHIYIHDGDIDQTIQKINNIHSIESVEVHIGNSDLVANVLYTDSKELIRTISDIKHIEGVDRILWSEEVYNVKSNNNIIPDLLGFVS